MLFRSGANTFVKGNDNNEHSVVLQVNRGDDLLAGQLIKLDLIKIDVEGFEMPALRGLQQTIAKFRPMIIMELNHQETKDELQQAMADLFKDYVLYYPALVKSQSKSGLVRKLRRLFVQDRIQFKSLTDLSRDYAHAMLVPQEQIELIDMATIKLSRLP